MFVIAIFVTPVAEEITQFSDEIKMRLISQLIKVISRVIQKLLRHLNGTAILTFCVLSLLRVLPVLN